MNDRIIFEAKKLRDRFGIGEHATVDLESILVTNDDITYITFPMPDNMSAICIKDNSNKVIAINSEHTVGRQRFSLAHELYHLYMQDDFTFSVCTNDQKKPKEEVNADTFASYFLLPHNALYWFAENELDLNLFDVKNTISLEDIIKIEQFYKISHLALLIRLGADKIITNEQKEEYKKISISSEARALGYDDTLYQKPYKQNNCNGKYIKLAEYMLRKDIIDKQDYNSYMMDVLSI